MMLARAGFPIQLMAECYVATVRDAALPNKRGLPNSALEMHLDGCVPAGGGLCARQIRRR